MSSHGDESETVQYLLEEDLDKVVDYESDTDFVGPNASLLPPSLVKTTHVVSQTRS